MLQIINRPKSFTKHVTRCCWCVTIRDTVNLITRENGRKRAGKSSHGVTASRVIFRASADGGPQGNL